LWTSHCPLGKMPAHGRVTRQVTRKAIGSWPRRLRRRPRTAIKPLARKCSSSSNRNRGCAGSRSRRASIDRTEPRDSARIRTLREAEALLEPIEGADSTHQEHSETVVGNSRSTGSNICDFGSDDGSLASRLSHSRLPPSSQSHRLVATPLAVAAGNRQSHWPRGATCGCSLATAKAIGREAPLAVAVWQPPKPLAARPMAPDQPGGQAIGRPPRRWTCRWSTVWPPFRPLFTTSR